ncbi:hypothetical protein [Tsukamurella ocularis]|uniref:hypothetical protein n=1 Tax=Tsukamurella ocularis TaxID=1970234 RepID=UPI002166EDF4|nr:hypothetical protein [Tsukamurella ocularis]MCS3781712.1 phenylacetate-CoA ligase [Tsukamurella ocularis]MCS3788206.1 phenylacetate-CoA ligase [Tsukamurella ocularis]MCS3851926.1 phenylacetate-CoA ligase [Tsukamurella ocularis]
MNSEDCGGALSAPPQLQPPHTQVRPIASKFLDAVRDVPFYRGRIVDGNAAIITKREVAKEFPESFMTAATASALDTGEAQIVFSTGTNHARMALIRPPLFLLKSYYSIWQAHPMIGESFRRGMPRVSITTRLATDHVMRVNSESGAEELRSSRWLDSRTLYINRVLDPADWTDSDVAEMVEEITQARRTTGGYHLDCSANHLAHLLLRADIPDPDSIVNAYEMMPTNTRRFIERRLSRSVVDLFGSTELGYMFYSDSSQGYVPYLEDMEAELIPISGGRGIHVLVVSSIRNQFMPLIRYRTGDCVLTDDGSADPNKIVKFVGREPELFSGPVGLIAHGELDEVIAAHAPDVFLYKLDVTDSDAVLAYTTFSGEPLMQETSLELRAALSNLTGLQPMTAEHHSRIDIGISGKYRWLNDGRTDVTSE